MTAVTLKFRKINDSVKTPTKQTVGSGAYDIHAYISEPIEIKPGEYKPVPTGIYVEIPQGFILSVRPRSGLAINYGISLINTPGTIDSDYRGEIKVLIVNHGMETYILKNGDRIAQLILERTYEIEWTETDELKSTSRGENGFGSTGKY